MGWRERAGLAGVGVPGGPALHGKRALARWVLLHERAWPAVWPALGVIGAYAVFGLLDGPALLPPWPRNILALLVLLGVAGLLWRGLRRVRLPSQAEGDRRLERDSGLQHRPLAALTDRPALGGAGAEALWSAHLARMAAQIGRLRLRLPRPGVAAQDRRALRGGLVVLLAAGLIVAGADAPARLGRAAWPGLPVMAPGIPVQLRAWATPPAYTGLPPVLLRMDAASLALPAGSHLTVSVTGTRAMPSLTLDGAATPFRPLDRESWQADRDLPRGGRLVVARGGRALGAWELTAIPDRPPTAAFTAPPGPAPRATPGHAAATRLPWRAADDYGVTGLAAELRLRDRPDAPPLRLEIPLTAAPREAHGVFDQDLEANPWAGLPVVGRLVARDATGQTGQSDEAAFSLPERQFHNPVAAAVIAIRKALSVQPKQREAAAAGLEAIAASPADYDNAPYVAVELGAAAGLLGRPEGVAAAQERLWMLALSLEERAPERTAAALAAAQRAVREALQKAQPDPKLDQRMAALERALAKHLQALAEQARREQAVTPGAELTARDMQRLAQQMRDAARQGQMDTARQRLAELDRLLKQLQTAEAHPGARSPSQQVQQRQRGQDQVSALQDMIRIEGGLLDRTRRRDGAFPSQPEPGGADDARRQAALRRALGELMDRFSELTGKLPKPLGDADLAMRGAGQALAQGQDGSAAAAERRAIEALQQAGRAMGQQLAQMGLQPGPGQQGEGQGQQPGQGDQQADGTGPGDGSSGPGQRGTQLDPLGRPVEEGAFGQENGDVHIPDRFDAGRSRALQNELRKRDADRSRPQQELDYIGRLLKPF